jgi:hypothetical protein
MANGTVLHQRNSALQVTLLDAVTATSDGAWVDTIDYAEGNVHVAGITTATVQIRGYNLASTAPANTVHGFQIGSNITATADNQAGIALATMPRFLKVMVSGYTGGTITAACIIRNHHG